MEILPHAQIPFRRHDRGMPERQLDLLERGVTFVGQLGEGAPQIMRAARNADVTAILDHKLKNGLGAQTVVGNAATFVDGSSDTSGGDTGSARPRIDGHFRPTGHGDGTDAAVLTPQIDDDPPPFPLLNVFEVELGELVPAESATEEKRQEGSISLAFQARPLGCRDEFFRLFLDEPVPCPYAMLLDALDAGDPRGYLGPKEPIVGGFIGEFSDGGQTLIDAGGREAPLLETGAILLDRGLGEASRGIAREPK